MKKVIELVGPPGSGKTFFINNKMEEFFRDKNIDFTYSHKNKKGKFYRFTSKLIATLMFLFINPLHFFKIIIKIKKNKNIFQTLIFSSNYFFLLKIVIFSKRKIIVLDQGFYQLNYAINKNHNSDFINEIVKFINKKNVKIVPVSFIIDVETLKSRFEKRESIKYSKDYYEDLIFSYKYYASNANIVYSYKDFNKIINC